MIPKRQATGTRRAALLHCMTNCTPGLRRMDFRIDKLISKSPPKSLRKWRKQTYIKLSIHQWHTRVGHFPLHCKSSSLRTQKCALFRESLVASSASKLFYSCCYVHMVKRVWDLAANQRGFFYQYVCVLINHHRFEQTGHPVLSGTSTWETCDRSGYNSTLLACTRIGKHRLQLYRQHCSRPVSGLLLGKIATCDDHTEAVDLL